MHDNAAHTTMQQRCETQDVGARLQRDLHNQAVAGDRWLPDNLFDDVPLMTIQTNKIGKGHLNQRQHHADDADIKGRPGQKHMRQPVYLLETLSREPGEPREEQQGNMCVYCNDGKEHKCSLAEACREQIWLLSQVWQL